MAYSDGGQPQTQTFQNSRLYITRLLDSSLPSFRSSVAPLYSNLKNLPLNEQLFLQQSIFMHGLHYNSLPYTFGTYCKQPEHRYPTRYATSGNYVLPLSSTNRGQSSIKYTGPKAWAETPKNIKDIAFKKPFSNKLKEHILNIIF